MKNLFTLLTLILSLAPLAQTHEIIKHDGTKMEVNFVKQESKLIYYTSQNSSEQKTMSQFAIYKLEEKAKKEAITLSEKVIVNGKRDYNKVIILTPMQTEGLRESGSISSFFGKTKGQSNLGYITQAHKRLKQHSASKGSPFMVIISDQPKELKARLYSY